MPSKGIKAVSVNPKHEAFKQVELRATRHAHGQGFSGVMLRDLERYYSAIERARKILIHTLNDKEFKLLDEILSLSKPSIQSADNLIPTVSIYLEETKRYKQNENLINVIYTNKTVNAMAIIDAFEFMEAKGLKSLKDAMIALDNMGV